MTARMRLYGALLLPLALVPAELGCEDGGGGGVGGGTPAAIVIANPKGGEVFAVDTHVDIQWQLREEVPLVNIDVSRDGGLTWQPLVADWDATTGSYDWTVTGPASTECLVRVRDATYELPEDASDATFTITVP